MRGWNGNPARPGPSTVLGLQMRTQILAVVALIPVVGSAQTIISVYNRDTHQEFRLRSASVVHTMIGPIVRTSTWLIFDNPSQIPTEASLNFDLPPGSTLGGFAYQYGDEYVPGRLMDKARAWQIYTAITKRGRDPGIMEQTSSVAYHCQIFPIKVGRDLRIRLWTVAPLLPNGSGWTLPKPDIRLTGTVALTEWKVRDALDDHGLRDAATFPIRVTGQTEAVAQRFKDGRIYVVGRVRLPSRAAPTIEIEHAFYEPQYRAGQGAEVTDKVKGSIAAGATTVAAENYLLEDPNPGIFKQLRVIYRINGREMTQTVPEHELFRPMEQMPDAPKISGLQDVKTVFLDKWTVAFYGRQPVKARPIVADFEGKHIDVRPHRLGSGTDAARLWAQEMLTTHSVPPKSLASFSLWYGAPSRATALLAVPKAEMRAYLRREADRLQREMEADRANRTWGGRGGQGLNWRAGRGGDPEIRVVIPGAFRASAILPDGRVLALSKIADGSGREVWGGNFEVPARMPEGIYTVRVLGDKADGSVEEQDWTYTVNRTPPVGRAEVIVDPRVNQINPGAHRLRVTAAPKLAEVAVYALDGSRLILTETKPGVYEAELTEKFSGRLIVVMKDDAGNKGEIVCLVSP